MTRFASSHWYVSLLLVCGSALAAPAAPTGAPPNAGPLAAAPTPPAVACPTTDRGARLPYHVGGTWVRDCNRPLTREYFRVFTETAGKATTAYLIPRPDGTTALRAACARKRLRPTLDRYGWCNPSVDPDRVNGMTIDDALAISHALHEHLRFTGSAQGVAPYPMPDDVAVVCAARGRAAALDSACGAYKPRANAIAMIPTADSARAMAAALNRLYGIR